jgi:hypothetical protein
MESIEYLVIGLSLGTSILGWQAGAIATQILAYLLA